ncbi:TPA: hypothetical protein HA318_00720 [Candidatus Micrarchaeota archaeon]|nr:MAG: hypothetical protein AUJ65_00660 [Candidatus Micrarchaeota archaeon CG1_02_51_15]HII38511.1 hypothetical protein [Candidatus Micrarchaeota archaeon]
MSSLLRDRPRLGSLKEELRSRREELEQTQENYLKSLGVDDKHARLFEIAREIVRGKGLRKDAIYFAAYKSVPLHKEIGRRLGLTLDEVNYLFPWEIPALLKKGEKVSPDEMKARHKRYLVLSENNVAKILVGDVADTFFNSMGIAVTSVDKGIRELKGQCASPGQGRGIVCIVNSPEDLPKMNAGDVLVSHATDPSLVVGMKKASAIVTDMGGIACHAAIVSRELGIPCLVGTKTVTKSFRDGDLVEVDATHGVIRRIVAGE